MSVQFAHYGQFYSRSNALTAYNSCRGTLRPRPKSSFAFRTAWHAGISCGKLRIRQTMRLSVVPFEITRMVPVCALMACRGPSTFLLEPIMPSYLARPRTSAPHAQSGRCFFATFHCSQAHPKSLPRGTALLPRKRIYCAAAVMSWPHGRMAAQAQRPKSLPPAYNVTVNGTADPLHRHQSSTESLSVSACARAVGFRSISESLVRRAPEVTARNCRRRRWPTSLPRTLPHEPNRC